MKKSILTGISVAALIAATAGPSMAGVNCGIVNRDLKLGRTPTDISERMGISVADVQECKSKGDNATTGTPTPQPKPESGPKNVTSPASGAGQ